MRGGNPRVWEGDVIFVCFVVIFQLNFPTPGCVAKPYHLLTHSWLAGRPAVRPSIHDWNLISLVSFRNHLLGEKPSRKMLFVVPKLEIYSI